MGERRSYKPGVIGSSPILRTIYPSSSIGRNTPAGVIRVRLPSWSYMNNVAPDVQQVIKNIAERAKNRNGMELLPIKFALVSVIWVQWKKVATSGH